MVLTDGIFIGTELRQALVQKILKPGGGVLMGHGVGETIGLTEAPQPLVSQGSAGLANQGGLGLNRPIRHNNRLGQFFAVVGVKTPSTADRRAIGVNQQVHPPALHLIEAPHQGFFARSKKVGHNLVRGQQHRCRQQLQPALALTAERRQPLVEQIIDRVDEMEAAHTVLPELEKMLFRGRGEVVRAMADLKSLITQPLHVGRDRGAMEQQTLEMNPQRPSGIRAEEKWILEQNDRASRLQRGMVREELMGKDQRDLHGSPSAGLTRQTAGTSTDRRGITTLHLTGHWTEHSRSAVHDDFLSMALLIVEAKHELPMVLGTASDAIGADGTGAKTGRGKSRLDNVETDQNRNCEQKPAHDRFNQDHHSAGSRSKMWMVLASSGTRP